ncbi:hypothetical protein BH09GEM1_BH09GEM1_00070 [soil metagenome]
MNAVTVFSLLSMLGAGASPSMPASTASASQPAVVAPAVRSHPLLRDLAGFRGARVGETP